MTNTTPTALHIQRRPRMKHSALMAAAAAVTWPEGKEKPSSAGELNSIVTGSLARDYDSSPCLHVLQSRTASFTFEEAVPWTRDGEDGGRHLTLDFL